MLNDNKVLYSSILNMHVVRPQHNTFFISLVYMHVYACKIIDVEALMQSTCVCTRGACDNLHEHTCMSVMYMPNLNCIHVDIHMNCKPRMMV